MMYDLKLGKNRKTTAEQILPTIQSSAGEIAPTTTVSVFKHLKLK